MDEKILHEHLAKAMSWDEAHLDWDTALAGLQAKHSGTKLAGALYSAWELLKHVRIAQWDILEFQCNPNHISPDFPSRCWSNVPVAPDVDTKLAYPLTYPCTYLSSAFAPAGPFLTIRELRNTV